MKNYLLPLFITICFNSVIAQTRVVEKDIDFPKARIGVSPSALTNMCFQFSFDRRIKERRNFSLEAGYIATDFVTGPGFKIRPGIEGIIVTSSWVALTGGVHFNYRHTFGLSDITTVSRNGDFQRISYNQLGQIRRVGINLSESLLFKLNDRLFLDIGSGLGFERLDISNVNFFRDFNNLAQINNVGVVVQTTFQPLFYVNINVSYTISK